MADRQLSFPQISGRKEHQVAGDNSTTASEKQLDVESPIVYHYLTFETELPHLSNINHVAGAAPPPPQPDLTPYISPFLWSKTRKNVAVYLSCMATAFTAYTAGAYEAPAAAMAEEWSVSMEAILIGITTFCCGFAIAPMVLAPFSEINGRYPVFVSSGILYWICQVCCAVTRSYPGMIVARFWVGAGSSVFSTMVGGVVSDLYHADERNTPMALFSGAALFGTGLGPLVSGFVAQNAHWRWVFWVQVMTVGVLVSAMILFFKETRGSILLSRKAVCLNRWYEEREDAGYVGVEMPGADGQSKESQRIRWIVKSDEERESIRKMIGISVYRPFRKSFSPVLRTFSR
jgi:multidrug resistance protein